jgi:hypothetical protein
MGYTPPEFARGRAQPLMQTCQSTLLSRKVAETAYWESLPPLGYNHGLVPWVDRFGCNSV